MSKDMALVSLDAQLQQEPIRAGFGRGLLAAGKRWPNSVAASANRTDST